MRGRGIVGARRWPGGWAGQRGPGASPPFPPHALSRRWLPGSGLALRPPPPHATARPAPRPYAGPHRPTPPPGGAMQGPGAPSVDGPGAPSVDGPGAPSVDGPGAPSVDGPGAPSVSTAGGPGIGDIGRTKGMTVKEDSIFGDGIRTHHACAAGKQ